MHSGPVRRLIGLVPATALIAMLAVSSFPASVLAATPTSFFNGFETNTTGWTPYGGSTITRVASGDTSTAYASGVTPATGSDYARLGKATVNDTCANGGGTQDRYRGPYTFFSGASSTFPTGGYSTAVDIYLDVAYAQAHLDTRFDWSSAVADTTGTTGVRDFVFNVATDATGFVIAGGNNADRCGADPASNASGIHVTASGWYTFKHTFTGVVGGVLSVSLDLINKSTNATVGHWVLSNPADIIGTTVGGNYYGWFAQNEFDGLAIDNSRLDAPGHSSFTGFYAPIDNSGIVNTIKGGSVVPVKFNLYDASGVQVTDPSLVTAVATQTACASAAATDAIELVSPAATALRYDATAGQFIWNWKTPKSPGTCWTVTATATTDGVSISALFLLK